MKHPTETLLSGREKLTAPSSIAKVVGPATDGSGDYMVTLLDTGGTVQASKAQPSLALSPNQAVNVLRADSSGRFKNTGYTILGPTSAKGSSNVAQVVGITSKPGASVTLITSGGSEITSLAFHADDVKTVLVYGTGLDTVTFSYGSPDLTDNVAKVITPTQVTLQIKAAHVPALGSFDLTIGSVVLKRFFTITN